MGELINNEDIILNVTIFYEGKLLNTNDIRKMIL